MKLCQLCLASAVCFWALGLAGCEKPDEPESPSTEDPSSASDASAKGSAGEESGDTGGTSEKKSSETKTSETKTSEKISSDVAKRDLPPLVPQGRTGDPVSKPGSQLTSSGIEYAVLEEGVGPEPELGDKVKLHLTGWFRNGPVLGRVFWNSRDDGVTHAYRLDEQDLIPGLVESLSQMKAGERRWVVLPSKLAYGEVGYSGVVPPNRDLVLDVELVSFAGS